MARHPAVQECIPAYASLLVKYAAPKITAYTLKEYIFGLELSPPKQEIGYLHELPVCYDEQLAPDLISAAKTLKLAPAELVELHANTEYLVYQLGFQPGFGFLGRTDKRLEIARRANPRKAVAAGSVGITGRQTGVYPTASPGGWQLIGRCPWPFLRTGRDFSRLQAGDRVRFFSVERAEFDHLQNTVAPWPER